MMRKTEVFELQRIDGKNVKVLIGTGMSHTFEWAYDEYENGPALYSTAIIEMPDGSVKNVPVENIRFVSAEQINLSNDKEG